MVHDRRIAILACVHLCVDTSRDMDSGRVTALENTDTNVTYITPPTIRPMAIFIHEERKKSREHLERKTNYGILKS